MWLHVTITFKIVHRRGADRTLNHLVLIEHRKFNDRAIEVEAPHLASPKRHCEFSTERSHCVVCASAAPHIWAAHLAPLNLSAAHCYSAPAAASAAPHIWAAHLAPLNLSAAHCYSAPAAAHCRTGLMKSPPKMMLPSP